MGVHIGDDCGFTTSLQDCSSAKTRVKYTSTRAILDEIASDPLLMRYSVLVVDDAHERTIDTDLVLALVKWFDL
jgi:HrpA-like RNA helicase